VSAVERRAAGDGGALRAVVLSYGGGGEVGPLLSSLLAEGMAAERILVVHNPARPGEPDPALPAGVVVLRSSHNLGYAAGMNRGIERQLERGCELLLLLTHDARLRPGSLARLRGAAEAHPDYGLLGPALVFAGSERPFSLGGLSRAGGGMEHRTARPEPEDGVAACDWVDGGTVLVRSAVLERVGHFDERFWSYFEEAELCLRARRSGFRVGVVLDAIAEQAPGGPGRPGVWSYLMTRNGIAYAWRAAGPGGLALASARAVFEVGVELLRVLARGLRLRPGSPTEPWALAVGTARGLLDFYRRRWGPPPPLPGAGDVANLAPPGGDGGA
jgi:N-acetylglucosaminyl-diphospho-decaprenol L-rhamnosyltransferase